MKKTTIETATLAGEHHRLPQSPQIEAIRAKGEYKIRLTSLSIVLVLVTGGITFSLLYPASLAAIWSVTTPIILTILGLALKNNGKGNPTNK